MSKKTYQFDSDDDDADEPMLTQETVEAPPSPAPMEESDEEEFAPEPPKPAPKKAAAPKKAPVLNVGALLRVYNDSKIFSS